MKLLDLQGMTNMWVDGGFRNTKVEKFSIYKDNLIQYTNLCTNWAQMLREIRDYFRELLEDLGNNKPFEALFNQELNRQLDDLDIKANANFSRQIFTDDSYLTSSLYRNNKNHRLVLYKDNETGESKCICAVYIDEVIWVLNTMIKVFNTLTDSEYKIVIYYEHKEEPYIPIDDEEEIIIETTKEDIYLKIDELTSTLLEVAKEIITLREVVQKMR